MLGKGVRAACTAAALCSSANHHSQERFYWKEFISRVYQRCPLVYFPASQRLTKAVVFTHGKLMLPMRCCLQRYKGDGAVNSPFEGIFHLVLCLLFISLSPPFYRMI